MVEREKKHLHKKIKQFVIKNTSLKGKSGCDKSFFKSDLSMANFCLFTIILG